MTTKTEGQRVDEWLAKDREIEQKIKNKTLTIDEFLRLPSKGF